MPPGFDPLSGYPERGDDALLEGARAFRRRMATRRSVRAFSERAVPRAVLETCVAAAARAPSGANQQPWHFVVVTDPTVRRRIREAAEREEQAFYRERAPRAWLEALEPLGTDAEKPFLERAGALIAVFAQPYGVGADGARTKHYYVQESVGIATGFLIAALHEAGLACLTHTPSPMRFLNELLDRPPHERPYLLLVVGHPAADAEVPRLRRKPFDEVATFV